MRKIVQIATTEIKIDGSVHVTTALCNDGTVWELLSPDEVSDEGGWHQLPPIPQGE